MAQRATSLGPKPSLCFFLFLVFSFFVFNRKACFPLKKAILVYLSVFPFVSLQPFLDLPLFSLSLSLFLLLFFSFFLRSCFSFLFLVLAFSFCVFAFSFQLFFCFSFVCLLSSFVLNHKSWFVFVLHLVFFFLLWYFVIFWFLETNQKHPWKMEIPKIAKMKMQKKRTFWQEQLAQVCSQNTIKIGVSAQKN